MLRWVLVVLAGLGALMPLQAGAQAKDPVISEIRVKGNKVTEESLVRFSCGLAVGQRLVLPDDPARAIRNLYKLNSFSDIQIFLDSDVEEGIAVEIVVTEYPKLGEVRFEGNKAIGSKKLKKKIGFIAGQWISPREQRRAENKILGFYKEEGYLLAEVTAKQGTPDEEGSVPVSFQIREGKKVRLRAIKFFGNTAFVGEKLRKQMKETKQVGGLFGRNKYTEKEYQVDKLKVIEFYRQNGYRDAEILSDSLYYDKNKSDLFIDITLREGPIYKFGKITWDGNAQVKDVGIDELTVAEEGAVYSSERVAKSNEQIKNLYSDIGYIGAQVFPRETPNEDHAIDLHLEIIENDPWKIRQITITGNTKTKDRVIRRELWIHPGETFRGSGIERSMRNIQQLNYFSNVIPDVRPVEETSELDVTFKVEEKSTGTASVGAGYSEQDKLVGTIQLQIPNFMGNGQVLDFQWEFGSRRKTFRVGFTEPWLFNTPTSVSGALFRDTQRIFEDFDQRRQGGVVRLGRRLRWPDFSRVSVGYSLQQTKFFNFSSDLGPATLESLRNNVTSSVELNYTRDSRNLPMFASSGSAFSYTPTLAGGPLGGNTNFHKHEIVTSFYFPLVWRFALNLKTQLGVVDGYGSTTVPYNERFTPGGVSLFDGTMVRGYPEQSLGPRTSGRTPIGGHSQLLFNLQVTIPIVKQQFFGLLFADAGNAWGSLSEMSVLDLRRSVGFGIRLMAPVVGIMGFDFAWGVDRRRVDGLRPQMMTHFQFGPQSF